MKKLPSDGKLLFVYLITNPHTHVSGIYVLPRIIVQLETGLSKRTVDTLCDTLSSFGFCAFDPAKDVIWVKNMMAYQGKGDKNARSAAAHVTEDLHNSFLCKQFIEVYPAIKTYIAPEKLHTLLDTLSHGVSEFGTPDPDPDPDPDPEQEQEQEQEQNTDPPLRVEKILLGKFKNVKLLPDEHGKLIEQFGEPGTVERIENLSEYIASKGKKYSNHYATILTWERKNGNGNGTHQQSGRSGSPTAGAGSGKLPARPYTPKQ